MNNQQFQIDPMERLASSKREFGEFGGANASIEVSDQHNKDAFPQLQFPSHLSLLDHRSLTLPAAPLLSHRSLQPSQSSTPPLSQTSLLASKAPKKAATSMEGLSALQWPISAGN
jgi:hypothetical protein